MSEKASVHLLVSGLVQGVFYRMFVLHEATGLGLSGMVRNLRDGRVEVTAEGDRERLKILVQRLRTGPPGAVVREVAESWDEYRTDYDGFHIEYD